PEGRALCEAFRLDPLGTIASGSLLLSVSASDADGVVAACRDGGITCAAIGKVTPASEGVSLVTGGIARPMSSFPQDEITNVLSEVEMPEIGYAARQAPMARNAMVASCHPLATLAGVEVLKSGGNVADAAVAINAVLGVTQPNDCGLGGDFF